MLWSQIIDESLELTTRRECKKRSATLIRNRTIVESARATSKACVSETSGCLDHIREAMVPKMLHWVQRSSYIYSVAKGWNHTISYTTFAFVTFSLK
jgi:hypothetical protein